MRPTPSDRRTPKTRPNLPAGLAWIAALLLAGSAQATLECPNGGNLLPNCGFETSDTSFWDFSVGDGSFVTSSAEANGGLASGVGNAANVTSNRFLVLIEACIEDVAPSTDYEYGAWVKASSTNTFLGLDCTTGIEELGPSETACGGSHIEEGNGSIGAGFDSFTELRGQSPYVTSAGTADVLIGVSCLRELDNGDFDLYIDDVFLIPALTIFKDGFASGKTCDWSAYTGGC